MSGFLSGRKILVVRFIVNALALTAIVSYACFAFPVLWLAVFKDGIIATFILTNWFLVSSILSGICIGGAVTFPAWRSGWTEPLGHSCKH